LKINSLTLYEKLSLLISFVGAISLVFIFFFQTMQATASAELSGESMEKNMDLSRKNMELLGENMKLSKKTIDLSVASMKSSMYAIVNTQTLEMDKVFLERPHLRPYFYDNEDLSKIRDKKTLREVMSVAEYQLDFFDLVMTQLDYIPTDKDSPEDKVTWKKYIVDSFANSPALCKRIADDPDWYMTSLVTLSTEPCKNPD